MGGPWRVSQGSQRRLWWRWGVGLALPATAQQGDDADALNSQVIKLYGEGKYAEAIPLAQRVLAIREKALGEDGLPSAKGQRRTSASGFNVLGGAAHATLES